MTLLICKKGLVFMNLRPMQAVWLLLLGKGVRDIVCAPIQIGPGT